MSSTPSVPSMSQASYSKPSFTCNAVETCMSAQCAKPPCDVDVKGVKFTIKAAKVTYRTNAASVVKSTGSLIDVGAMVAPMVA